MIITGILTLITAVAYWCVPSLYRWTVHTDRQHVRFFFPDSPTNAWFLTPEERAKAVKRIQVRTFPSSSIALPQIGSRATKPVSRTSTSRSSSTHQLCCTSLYAILIDHLCRFYEALTDPKTWLFALFSALDNIPNSLTNQRQIIVSSFGFTNLQTTLLGCVDGLIEIITIFTGVRIAARYQDSRAYVGAIYFIPNILGVLLINFLPWDNKVGLLFGQWLTGELIA